AEDSGLLPSAPLHAANSRRVATERGVFFVIPVFPAERGYSDGQVDSYWQVSQVTRSGRQEQSPHRTARHPERYPGPRPGADRWWLAGGTRRRVRVIRQDQELPLAREWATLPRLSPAVRRAGRRAARHRRSDGGARPQARRGNDPLDRSCRAVAARARQ